MWSSVGLPQPDRTLAHPEYQRALRTIFGYSAHSRTAAEVRADRLRKVARLSALLQLLGSPQDRFDTILVGGTKGKGSIAAMLSSVLCAGGQRVGRYAQPHLVSWRERTWVNGRYIAPDDVVRLLPAVEAAARRLAETESELGPPTTFEIGTALSLVHFAESGVKIAVVEVGVGGRTDATNALDPIVSVIAPVSVDHADVIGPTLEDIAREKAGIMRPGRPVISAPQPSSVAGILRESAHALGPHLAVVGEHWTWVSRSHSPSPCPGRGPFDLQGGEDEYADLALPLMGDFQRDNATAAIAAAHASNHIARSVFDTSVRQGLAAVQWVGRIHQLREQPIVVLDGAHNGESAERLMATLAECFQYRRLIAVIGMSDGKDLDGFLAPVLDGADEIIATAASHSRSIPADDLAREAASIRDQRGRGDVAITVVGSSQQALAAALERASPDDAICVAGSLFLIGELLESPAPWHIACTDGA